MQAVGRRRASAAVVIALTGILLVVGVHGGRTEAAAGPGDEVVVEPALAALLPGEDGGSVSRLYQAYFLRSPDAGGLAYWLGVRGSGVSLAQISEEFARSAEFRSRYGSLSDHEFVALVYRNVLGRLPDAGGFQHWTTNLAGGLTRGGMMIGFSDSVEFKRKVGTALLSPSSSSDGSMPSAPAGTYTFKSEHDGSPLRWPACQEVSVVINTAGAPLGARAAVASALEHLSAAMKIRWRITGETTERAGSLEEAFDRPPVQIDRYGDRFAPVLISWPSKWRDGDSALGYGGFAAAQDADGLRIVTGQVILRSGAALTGPQLVSLLLHELGHVANLGHVQAADQVMFPTLVGFESYQNGDRAGLARTGGWDTHCDDAVEAAGMADLTALDGLPATEVGPVAYGDDAELVVAP